MLDGKCGDGVGLNVRAGRCGSGGDSPVAKHSGSGGADGPLDEDRDVGRAVVSVGRPNDRF